MYLHTVQCLVNHGFSDAFVEEINKVVNDNTER